LTFSHPFFSTFDFERGLFVTSAMIAALVAARLGGDVDCMGGGGRDELPPRIGVNPSRRLPLGVFAPSSRPTGALSTENDWTGTLSWSSKSSGALRFLPMDDDDEDAGKDSMG
jgi:hypothetical protein